MTDAPTPPGPTRNWGAVLLTILASVLVVVDVAGDVQSAEVTNSDGALEFVLTVITCVLLPIGILIATWPLAFGTRRLTGVAGTTVAGRAAFAGWGLFVALGLLGGLLPLIDPVSLWDRDGIIGEAIDILSLAFGVVAGIFVLRARVTRGFARISMFVSLALSATSVLLFAVHDSGQFTEAGFGDQLDVQFLFTLLAFGAPGLVALVLLGISYWHAGLSAEKATS